MQYLDANSTAGNVGLYKGEEAMKAYAGYAAQRFGGLLAEHPANGIEDVRFAATVRADDGGDSFVKFEKRFVREGFETDELERVKMHAAGATISLRAVTVA